MSVPTPILSPSPAKTPLTRAEWCSLFAVTAMLLAQLACINVVDLDLYHEMALFRVALQNRAEAQASKGALALPSLPRQDPFAYTPTITPLVHHEWATGMVAYAVSMSMGATGLMALKYLVLFGVVGLCVYSARRRGASWPVFCLMAPVAIQLGVLGISTFRAQIFTLLFTALLLVFLDSDRAGSRRWIPAWLVLYVLWLNLHAGFVVGVGLIGLHWLEQAILQRKMQWRLLAVLAAMLGLVLVNPYGADYPRYLVRGLFMPRPRIVEWEPMWSDPGVLGALAVALMVALYAIRKIGWRNAPGALIVLVCAVAALRHVRHSNIFAVAWLCYVPGWLARTPLAAAIDAFWRRKARAVAAASVLVGAFCMILMLSKSPWRLDIPVMPKGAHYHGLLYPAGAVEYLKQQHFHGNVMTTYGSGSFVSWHLYPAVKVSLDSRYEVAYQPGVMEEICDFYDAKGLWQRTLEKYPTDLLLAPVKEKVTGLLATTDWKCVYRDDVFRLYARRGLQLPVINREGQKLVGTFP